MFLAWKQLDEFEPGIPGMERGKKVHSILASFVLRAIEKLKETDLEFEDLSGLLRKTITEALRASSVSGGMASRTRAADGKARLPWSFAKVARCRMGENAGRLVMDGG